jgi:integrase
VVENLRRLDGVIDESTLLGLSIDERVGEVNVRLGILASPKPGTDERPRITLRLFTVARISASLRDRHNIEPTPASDALERLAEELGPDQAVMMRTAAVLGLRWAECAGLTVGSVDTLRRMVTVGEQLRRGDRQLVAPKSNAGRRTMAVPAWLTEELSALMHRRTLTAADSGGLLFVNTRGRAWSYSPWRRSVWLPACTRAGLPGLRFRDLRALAATNLVAAGVDPKTAQARLGHSSPHMTLAIYARVTAEADRQAADKVGGMIGPRDGRAMDRRRRATLRAERGPDQPFH